MRELPLFPLGTVLFPHMVLPLHVFEERYRALMHDVLDGEREFGVTLISQGHEVGGGDRRSAVGTIASILRAEELDDGRWLAITVGTRRFRVKEWLPDDPYPRALVEELVDDHDVTAELLGSATVVPLLRRVLAKRTELGGSGVAPTFELATDAAVACWQLAVLAPVTPFDDQRLLVTEPCSARIALLEDLLTDLDRTLDLQLEGG